MAKKKRRLWNGTPAASEGQVPRGTVLVQQETIQASAYSGPLPPPEAMAKYEAILPGFTDRLLTNFEKQSTHRMGLRQARLVTTKEWGVAVKFSRW
jgi:uncharacterized membrane protein